MAHKKDTAEEQCPGGERGKKSIFEMKSSYALRLNYLCSSTMGDMLPNHEFLKPPNQLVHPALQG